ncbi:MAG: hypothetical protein IPK52_04130 [Chloroflexi bacterium]|nr:hypothetical protein [Chloroflexota bacterium]
MRRFLLSLAVLCLVTWGAVFYLLFEQHEQATVPLPTLMVLPSLTPSEYPDAHTISNRYTDRDGNAHLHLHPNGNRDLHANADPTLSTRVVEINAVMPGVYVPPTATDFPVGTILLAAPPQPVEPLPDATNQPSPYSGLVQLRVG